MTSSSDYLAEADGYSAWYNALAHTSAKKILILLTVDCVMKSDVHVYLLHASC